MSNRKLCAVGYPGSLPVDMRDPSDFQAVLSWLLKNTQLRRLAPEACEKALSAPSDEWSGAVEECFSAMNCPYQIPQERIDWLLRQLVSIENSDTDCRFRTSHNYESLSICKGDSSKFVAVENGFRRKHPLQHLDVTVHSPEFQAGMESLCKLLNIFPGENRVRTLHTIADCLENLSHHVSADANDVDLGGRIESLDEVPLGFSVEDKLLQDAMKIVRLLHIRHLRDLQTRMDEVLVLMQQVTANPQTDETLGKVGR